VTFGTRQCQLVSWYDTVGAFQTLRSSELQAGACAMHPNTPECGKIPACYLPTKWDWSAPSGAPLFQEYEIKELRGKTVAEVSGKSKYRWWFTKWIFNHLGNRTGPFNAELPGARKWAEAGPWIMRTDKFKISFSRERDYANTSPDLYVNYQELWKEPEIARYVFDWKEDIVPPARA